MPLNPEEQKNDENSFIREHIKSRPLSRKALVCAVLTALLLGVVFGGAAALTYRLGTSSGGSAETETADAEDTAAESADASREAADTENTADDGADEELSVSDYQKIKYELTSIGRTVRKSIVTVSATAQATDLFESDYETTDQVMGLVLSVDSSQIKILTQYDTVSAAEGIRVTFSSSEEADAAIAGYDATLGLAVLSVSTSGLSDTTLNNVTAAVFKTSGSALQGQVVVAVGMPSDGQILIQDGTITSNTGEITTEDGVYTVYTTSMLSTQDGSGVLINTDGEIIGIMMLSYNSSDEETLLTAVSAKELYPKIEKMLNGEAIAYLGATLVTVTTSIAEEYGLPAGVYVREVTDDAPAYDGGIQPGDIIIQIGSTEISTVEGVMDYLLECKPDQTVRVTVMRASGEDYSEVTCSVKLSQK